MYKQALLAGIVVISGLAFGKPNSEDLNKIRDQGFNHSQVMATLKHLTDNIGPRLSGSPELRVANDWTLEKLKSWGLDDAHLEPFEFGRGWSYSSISVNLISPRATSLHAIPVAWTPGTSGTIEADVFFLDAVSEDELDRYRGKIAGKIVLVSDPEEIGAPEAEIFKRYSADELKKMSQFDVSRPASNAATRPDVIANAIKKLNFRQALSAFLKSEGAKAAVYRSRRDAGLIRVFGLSQEQGQTFSVPAIILSAEHYNLLMRLLQDKIPARLSLAVAAQFHDKDKNSYNTIAEIPGSSRNDIVMLGAHLDSWHASTGGVDNGAGVAVVMEAMRILKAINFKPKRTVRIGLWTGEEQGLLGSGSYVAKHFATRPKPTDAKVLELGPGYWMRMGWPIKPLPDYERLSVYFNVDNGSGKFRGISTEGNIAAKSIFSEWFQPLSDLTEGVVSTNASQGTDHESFDDIGLPGFQFIQDELDYSSRLHHTHADSYDHVLADDVKQASVVLATFVYNAANAEARLPRKPLPTEPSAEERQQELDEAAKRQRKLDRDALRNLSTQKPGGGAGVVEAAPH